MRSPSGARAPRAASTACSRSRSGTASEGRCCWRATATASSRSTTRRSATVFVFGSEIKAILRASGVSHASSISKGWSSIFTFQNFFTDRTLFEDVQAAAAGLLHAGAARQRARPTSRALLGLRLSGAGSRARRRGVSWRSSIACSARRSTASWSATSRSARICQAAWTPARSPRSPAAQLPYIKSFTVRLRSAARPPAWSWASTSARRPSTCPTCSRPSTTRWCLRPATWSASCRGSPGISRSRASASAIPNFYAAQLAGKFVKVVLSGAGGDELFGGYPWRYYRAVVNDDFEHYVDKYYAFWQRLLPDGTLPRCLSPIWNDVRHVSTRDIFRERVPSPCGRALTRPEDYVNHSLYFEAKTFLHGLLVVEDKLSMAHWLETRVPFLDNDLVDFAMQLPARLKLGNLTEVVRLNENEPGGKTRAATSSGRATASCCCAR